MKKSTFIFVSLIFIIYSCTESVPEIPKSSAKEISSPSIPVPNATSSFDSGTNTYTYTVPANTNIKAIAFSFSLPAGATSVPAPGSVQDFSNPVKYTITAEDGSKSVMTVVVQVEKQKVTAGGQEIPDGIFKNTGSWSNRDSLLALYAKKIREVLNLSNAQVPDNLIFRIRNQNSVSPSLVGEAPLMNEDILIDLLKLKFEDLNPNEKNVDFFALANQSVFQKQLIKPNRAGYDQFGWWINRKFATGGVDKAKPGIGLVLGKVGANGNIDPFAGAEIIAIFQSPI
jgi:hypothetical protein